MCALIAFVCLGFSTDNDSPDGHELTEAFEASILFLQTFGSHL